MCVPVFCTRVYVCMCVCVCVYVCVCVSVYVCVFLYVCMLRIVCIVWPSGSGQRLGGFSSGFDSQVTVRSQSGQRSGHSQVTCFAGILRFLIKVLSIYIIKTLQRLPPDLGFA